MATPPRYHWLPVAEEEVSTTLPPTQKVMAPDALIVGVEGIGVTVTVVPVLAALLQPLVVAITVYVPAVVAVYV